jgi:hypothetical protein
MRVTPCKSCKKAIIWLKTAKDKPIPVDVDSWKSGQGLYDPTLGHKSHFGTCPHAAQHSKKTSTAPVFDDEVYLEAYASDGPSYVPELAPEVADLYQLCEDLDLDRMDVRSILAHQYELTGEPRLWSAEQIARAREAIHTTARERDAFISSWRVVTHPAERRPA